jgi:hypothetical protein
MSTSISVKKKMSNNVKRMIAQAQEEERTGRVHCTVYQVAEEIHDYC